MPVADLFRRRQAGPHPVERAGEVAPFPVQAGEVVAGVDRAPGVPARRRRVPCPFERAECEIVLAACPPGQADLADGHADPHRVACELGPAEVLGRVLERRLVVRLLPGGVAEPLERAHDPVGVVLRFELGKSTLQELATFCRGALVGEQSSQRAERLGDSSPVPILLRRTEDRPVRLLGALPVADVLAHLPEGEQHLPVLLAFEQRQESRA